jgi:hypothetical protein
VKIILKLIFTLTLLELFIGGGGRVFEFGSLTLRILLFFVNTLFILLLYFYEGKFPKYVIILSLSAVFILTFYSLLGLINNAQTSLIFEDVKPLSYFFSLIFFSYFIKSKQRIKLIISLLKKTSIFMAIVYLAIQLLFYFKKIEFFTFYNYVNNHISPSDFIFRGESGLFFYKGFFFMVIGLIFWIHCSNHKWKIIPIMIIIVAMIFSGTRGFILMFGLIYGLFYGIPLLLKMNLKLITAAIILICLSLNFFSQMEVKNRVISDSARIEQIEQVFQRITPTSLFFGHGFGIGVPIREVHFEIAYLEVFHKQGLLGLSILGIFIYFLYIEYKKFTNEYEIRKAFFLSILFTLLLSFTNPFFNNPIGLSLLSISLVSFKLLNKNSVVLLNNTDDGRK